MRVAYKRFLVHPLPEQPASRSVLRPVIPVHLLAGSTRVSYEALLDSGADYSIFHGEIGEVLGLKVRQGERVIFAGVSGVSQEGFRHLIRMRVGTHTFLCHAVFSYGLKTPYGILGQEGVFEKFSVMFDRSRGEIILLPRRSAH